MLYFSCDYLEGCHPAVLEALVRSNLEQHPGYGLDPWCEKAAAMIRERFACPEAAVMGYCSSKRENGRTTMISRARTTAPRTAAISIAFFSDMLDFLT